MAALPQSQTFGLKAKCLAKAKQHIQTAEAQRGGEDMQACDLDVPRHPADLDRETPGRSRTDLQRWLLEARPADGSHQNTNTEVWGSVWVRYYSKGGETVEGGSADEEQSCSSTSPPWNTSASFLLHPINQMLLFPTGWGSLEHVLLCWTKSDIYALSSQEALKFLHLTCDML